MKSSIFHLLLCFSRLSFLMVILISMFLISFIFSRATSPDGYFFKHLQAYIYCFITMLIKLIAFILLFSLVAIPNNFSTSVSTIVTPAFCRLFSICFHTFVAYLHLMSRWAIDSISAWQNVHLLSFNTPHFNNVSFVTRVWCKILNWMSRSLVEAVLDKVLRKKIKKVFFWQLSI